jgi:hypothetical protein
MEWQIAPFGHRILALRGVAVAEDGRDIESTKRMPHQEVLEQVISIADQAGPPRVFSEICGTTDIMRRLNYFVHTALAEEDDAALWRLRWRSNSGLRTPTEVFHS